MIRKVFRYPVELTDEQVITMPEGAQILSVARREGSRVVLGVGSNEAVELWALVDPYAPPEQRHIRVIGTGHPVPSDELDFLGTVQLAQGLLIFHIFEVI